MVAPHGWALPSLTRRVRGANAYPLHGLLRARCERPRCRGATEQRDELAPLHSITSSARPSKVIGKVRPSVFAVFRLIKNSVFVDCWTGRSAGLSPLRMRPTYVPARRYA